MQDAPPLPYVVGPRLPAMKFDGSKVTTSGMREERTSRLRFCARVSSGSTLDVDPRSLADDLRGVSCTLVVLFSFFAGCTGLAFDFCCGLGLADTLALSVTDAEALLSCSCSMRARLRAMFASRSSSL